jgi:hypothetical protein
MPQFGETGCGKTLLNEGHGFSHAVQSHSDEGFRVCVRYGSWDMPDEIGYLSRPLQALRYWLVPKKFAGNHLENRTSGAKALTDRTLYGTAEAVPFVKRVFP